MAETLSPNYGWTKPDPGASANTWGQTLNSTTDKIDAQVFANQQGMAPIGSGMLWFTDTPPANFVFAQGQSLSTAAPYDKLFAIFQYKYGGSGANFNMPNLTQKFMVGADAGAVGATGGEATHVLTVAEMPAHPHPITDVAHGHTATQPAHSHGDQGHWHDPAGSYQDAHHHNYVGPGGGGAWYYTSAPYGLQALNGSYPTGDATPALHISIGVGYANLAAAQPAITVAASGTGLSTTRNAGGGAAHENRPPFLSVNVAIRYA